MPCRAVPGCGNEALTCEFALLTESKPFYRADLWGDGEVKGEEAFVAYQLYHRPVLCNAALDEHKLSYISDIVYCV